jgi:hypothetical protein
MKKTILILILNLLLITTSTAQAVNLTIVKIEGVGTIGLPSNMEIQGGAYKETLEKYKEINGFSASKVIFQQKNLNNYNKQSFDTYARVFIRIEKGISGSYKKLNESLTQSEANEINTTFKNEIESSASNANATILEWYPASITKLNNQNAIKVGYKRQIGNNSPVLVSIYLLQNYDRRHIITFEYRLDKYNWQTTFTEIKSSINIKKK